MNPARTSHRRARLLILANSLALLLLLALTTLSFLCPWSYTFYQDLDAYTATVPSFPYWSAERSTFGCSLSDGKILILWSPAATPPYLDSGEILSCRHVWENPHASLNQCFELTSSQFHIADFAYTTYFVPHNPHFDAYTVRSLTLSMWFPHLPLAFSLLLCIRPARRMPTSLATNSI